MPRLICDMHLLGFSAALLKVGGIGASDPGLVMLLILASLVVAAAANAVPRAPDPCAAIGGQKWVAPSAVRACFESFPVNQKTKTNVRTFSSNPGGDKGGAKLTNCTDSRCCGEITGLPYLRQLSGSRAGAFHGRCTRGYSW